MERFVCIHGHFYQPPRENPWLGAIELQDSAYPYHDWNERVTAECYAPNASSRILDGEKRILNIVNNYARISFNFGPTLLSWLQQKDPEVYAAILDADQASAERFSGHGSAIAQAYNHVIMPLASRRDKRTQVMWGIRDFEHRFGRKPEGMWLPETAVDTETLETLAEMGLKFTVLAPHQASRVRRIEGQKTFELPAASIDPSRPYVIRLPSGRSLGVFFYDGPISRAVAFEGLLTSGEAFAGRLWSGFSEERDGPQLVHIATDGETYGHHHRHGDMALAYALDYIESQELARLTNYGEYLELRPPAHEVEVIENTSWSCVHGIERWRGDCGCSTGVYPRWNQAWRSPLRAALDWLRDTIAPLYEWRAGHLFADPWEARDAYIDVVLDRSPESVGRFLRKHGTHELDAGERVEALKLLELQHHAMLMYTSCGWFFDELSGIETVQVIQYAARAIQLAESLFGSDIEGPFLERLAEARSNLNGHEDGRRVYERFVKPAMLDLPNVCAHYAVSSLFTPYEERAPVYNYTVERQRYHALEAGRAKLAVGLAKITSDVTGESDHLSFGVLHFGDHNVSGGVRPFRGDEAFEALVRETAESFQQADFAQVLRHLDRQFGPTSYSVRSLFRDEQRRVLNEIMAVTLTEAESVYRQMYEHHAPLMHFLTDLRIPLPKAFRTASEYVIDLDLRRAFQEPELDLERIHALLDESASWRLDLDTAGLAHALRGVIDGRADELARDPLKLPKLQAMESAVDLARSLLFEVNLWKAQNVYHEMLHGVYPQVRARADSGDAQARKWAEHFVALGGKLSVRVE